MAKRSLRPTFDNFRVKAPTSLIPLRVKHRRSFLWVVQKMGDQVVSSAFAGPDRPMNGQY